MVIYHLGHYGFFSKAITHKLTFHKGEETVYLIDLVLCSSTVIEFLKKNGFAFHDQGLGKIITYSDKDFIDINDKNELKEKIILTFDKLFIENGIDNLKKAEIYTGFDTFNAFGIYLGIKGLSYTQMELGKGLLEINRYGLNNKKIYDELLKEYDVLSSGNSLVKSVLRVKDGRGKVLEKDVLIDYQNLQKQLSEEEKDKILNCFGMKELQKKGGVFNLIVCSSFWVILNLKMSIIVYQRIYRLIMDIFEIDDYPWIIKTHPSADFKIEGWDYWKQEDTLISAFFPVDYMPLLDNIQICAVYATSSTGIQDIYPDKRKINLPLISTFRNYQLLEYIYLACYIAKRLEDEKTVYHVWGIETEFVQTLVNFFATKKELVTVRGINTSVLKGNIITFIDNITYSEQNNFITALKNADDLVKVIFINRKGKSIASCLDSSCINILKYFILIELYKIENEKVVNIGEFYFFCKDDDIRKRMEEFIFSKTLRHEGYVIYACTKKWFENIELLDVYMNTEISKTII